MTKRTIVLLPGNGGPHFDHASWYTWLRDEFTKLGYSVVARDLPDPIEAHQDIWLPYMERELIRTSDSIVICHSSGAVAALRYLEKSKLAGAILIGCNYTDLGDAGEKAAGWYDAPWDWSTIKKNAGWIEQFHSLDDPFIPVAEPRFIHEQIGSIYHEYADRGHFMIEHNPVNDTFPEIVDLLCRRTQ